MQKIKPALTPKEQAVLRLTARGLTMDEIGAELRMPRRTVRYYSDKLRVKLDVSKRSHLIAAGQRYFG